MDAEEFKVKWLASSDGLYPFPEKEISILNIPEKDKRFLYVSGLPYNCAPFIGFGHHKGSHLSRLVDDWDFMNLDASFNPLYVIGSDGNGDPICVNNENGIVASYNHDGDFDELLMNSSISQLAECILLARDAIQQASEKYGAGKIWEEGQAKEIKDWYFSELKKIDPMAAEDGNFWVSYSGFAS